MNVGSPKGRESYGDGVPVVVAGVTPGQLETGKAGPQGEGAQATERSGTMRGMRNAESRSGAGRPPRTRQEGPAVHAALPADVQSRSCTCWPTGNIYSNEGAMTPGASGETADGMSEDKIDQIIGRCGTSATGSPRPAASTSRRRTGSSGPSACQRRRHSAVASREPSGSVLITHPFHPLSGQRLEVLFAKRRGRRGGAGRRER